MPVPPPPTAPDDVGTPAPPRGPARAGERSAVDDAVHEAVVVGTGFGGLAAAVRLLGAGVRDLVVLERAGDVGGTWRDNTYPGCACDVQSPLYSLSFAPNPAWSRAFAPQAEIQRYLQGVARDFGVLPLVRFHHEVLGARWDADGRHWRVDTSRGLVRARLLVLAHGALSEPAVPDLPGLERFRGPAFHSARWDHAADLAGRRVAVIGTGASAVQFVPELQPRVAGLTVYQRTPPWVIPRWDGRMSRARQTFYRHVPAAQRLVRAAIYARRELFVVPFQHPRLTWAFEATARLHLRRAVRDPALRAKLTPDYRIGCKRVLLSNTYLPALTQPNVEVVTERIVGVGERAVVTADGRERPADAIVFGTGFRPTAPPLAAHVRGRDGRSLAEAWGGSPRAYLGMAVAGFPNLFLLMGPNTTLGHSSVVYMLEVQAEYVAAAAAHLRARGLDAVEPRAEAEAAWVAAVDRRSAGTAWTAGGCASWYLDATGRNSVLWPDFTWRYRRQAARFDAEAYLETRAAVHA